MVHHVQKTFRSEIYVLEFVVSVEPEGVKMGVERKEELLVIFGASLGRDGDGKADEQPEQPNGVIFEIHNISIREVTK